MCEDTYLVV